ncbi:B-box-type_zinc finger [Hexamita inflata]|uniref:B-box-type zinc finger n=1 Tax=Hexamita inflata TaxID=28002 RepID=A0AA86QQI9_9EUKA|nr:B-box-type zinc finger [Hexamita inflata]
MQYVKISKDKAICDQTIPISCTENQVQSIKDLVVNKQSIQKIIKSLKQSEPRQTYIQKRGMIKMQDITQLYKETLNKLQSENYSQKSPKEVCLLILSLDKTMSTQFWNHITLESKQKSIYKVYAPKTYFQQQYCKVMYSYQLTEEDKQFILNFAQNNLTTPTIELTQQIFNSYFKDKDVFFYDIYYIIQRQERNSITKRSNYFQCESKKLLMSYTEIYRQGLHYVYKQDFKDKPPHEICNLISQLSKNLSLKFWFYLVKNITPKTDIFALRSYFSSYAKNYCTDKLNEDDIAQIAKAYEQNVNIGLNRQQIAQQINNTLFQNRCIYFRELHSQIVKLEKEKGTNSNIKNKIYKQGNCYTCQKSKVKCYCKQCKEFFCRGCRTQHIKDSLHFEFGFQ